MTERISRRAGVDLWTEDFGDRDDPTVLLSAGGGASGIFWSERFCEDLAGAGRHVIRYDYRDVGLSSAVDFESDPYTIDDLAADAIGVLDAYGANRAHLVGWSQGGTISQAAALDHPDRVASLTSISSRPLPSAAVAAKATRELAGPPPEFLAAGAAVAFADDEDERISRFVAFVRAGGVTEPFDEQDLRMLAKRLFERSRADDGAANQARAGAITERRSETLAAIGARTLVIQGANDVVYPVGHGEAIVNAIPGAKLLVIERMGHIPRPEPPEMLAAIIEHTS